MRKRVGSEREGDRERGGREREGWRERVEKIDVEFEITSSHFKGKMYGGE